MFTFTAFFEYSSYVDYLEEEKSSLFARSDHRSGDYIYSCFYCEATTFKTVPLEITPCQLKFIRAVDHQHPRRDHKMLRFVCLMAVIIVTLAKPTEETSPADSDDEGMSFDVHSFMFQITFFVPWLEEDMAEVEEDTAEVVTVAVATAAAVMVAEVIIMELSQWIPFLF